MNVDLIITGLVSFLIGLTAQLFDRPRTAREKKDIPMGYTESKFKASKWVLLIVGVFLIIYGLFNET
jgi:uncharacterized membrane protein YiaA